MSDRKEKLLSLLERWEELGRRVSPVDLCVGCPELREELEAAIRYQGGWARQGAAPPALQQAHDGEEPKPVISGYDIGELLGRGGMGTVYKAREKDLDRIVAIKVIRGGLADATLLARLKEEGKALATLGNPYIVQVHAVGWWRSASGMELPYLALEYIDGKALDVLLGRRLVRPAEAASLVRMLACAVLHAHQKRVIHRDLKPGNVLLAPAADEPALNWSLGSLNHLPKLTDFGLARRAGDGVALTQSGALLGTPNYMAPEQAGDKVEEVGPPADVYGLGGILYWLLTGQHPFQAADAVEILERVRTQMPVPPRQLRGGDEVPEALDSLCLYCLAKKPAGRPSVTGLIQALERFLAALPGATLKSQALTRPEVGEGQTADELRPLQQRVERPSGPADRGMWRQWGKRVLGSRGLARRPQRLLLASGAVVVVALVAGLLLAGRPQRQAQTPGPAPQAPAPPTTAWFQGKLQDGKWEMPPEAEVPVGGLELLQPRLLDAKALLGPAEHRDMLQMQKANGCMTCFKTVVLSGRLRHPAAPKGVRWKRKWQEELQVYTAALLLESRDNLLVDLAKGIDPHSRHREAVFRPERQIDAAQPVTRPFWILLALFTLDGHTSDHLDREGWLDDPPFEVMWD